MSSMCHLANSKKFKISFYVKTYILLSCFVTSFLAVVNIDYNNGLDYEKLGTIENSGNDMNICTIRHQLSS